MVDDIRGFQYYQERLYRPFDPPKSPLRRFLEGVPLLIGYYAQNQLDFEKFMRAVDGHKRAVFFARQADGKWEDRLEAHNGVILTMEQADAVIQGVVSERIKRKSPAHSRPDATDPD